MHVEQLPAAEKIIKSYRKIVFPPNLQDGKGPMHLSMALKDQNGRNMPENGALYFTAHYDENGKLNEVSAPTGIKFASEDPNEIGYIEKNGKIYM